MSIHNTNIQRLTERMHIDEFYGDTNAEEVLSYLDAFTSQCSVMDSLGGITWLEMFETHLKGNARGRYTNHKYAQEAREQVNEERTRVDFKNRCLPKGIFLRGLHSRIRMTVRLRKPADMAECYYHAHWADTHRETEYHRRGDDSCRYGSKHSSTVSCEFRIL